MEEVWKRTFDELIIKPEEHPVLMTHHPLGPKKQKEKIIEVLMEKFNIPATYLAIPSLLTVYASGRACG
jgi:actin-related protein